MRNIKIEYSFDGRNYFGLQKQKDKLTIQGEIEKALKGLFKQDVNLIICGRTDRGVSALKAVANFYVNTEIEGEKICYALNQYLPEDIRIFKSEEVDFNFHSRHSSKNKTYVYSLYESKFLLPNFPFETQFKNKLNYKKMKQAIKYFKGTHDFTGFVNSACDIENKVRTILKTKLIKKEILGVNHYYFYFTGNGFLYNQVRIMVGTLILVGLNKLKPKEIKCLLKERSGRYVKHCMPAEGLTLFNIDYK